MIAIYASRYYIMLMKQVVFIFFKRIAQYILLKVGQQQYVSGRSLRFFARFACQLFKIVVRYYEPDIGKRVVLTKITHRNMLY